MAQEQSSSTAYLVIQQGQIILKRVELWKECTTIGRSRDSDIFLEDITVHRKQARIILTEIGYLLRDDHGSQDSFVNGKPITEQLLNNGDEILFGNTQLTFHAHEGTRPFQLPSSRGKELHIGKTPDPHAHVVSFLRLAHQQQNIELLSRMTIGRSRECDIFLEDLAVSRLHATILELQPTVYEIKDNHSATGTFVNGQVIDQQVLRDGDVIEIGMNAFTLHSSTSSS